MLEINRYLDLDLTVLWKPETPQAHALKAGLEGLSSGELPGIAFYLRVGRRSIELPSPPPLHPSTSTSTSTIRKQGARHSSVIHIVGLGFYNLYSGTIHS